MFPKPLESFIKCLILYSVATFMVEVDVFHSRHSLAGHPFFLWSERVVAILFTLEYLARWGMTANWRRYPFTPMSVIDLVAVVPFWIGFWVSAPWLGIIRALRILRLIKLSRYNPTMQRLFRSIYRVRKQLVAVSEVVLVVLLLGSVLMNLIEGPVQKSFSTIANSAWWCIVTLTTIGYGDAYPVTPAGKLVAAIMMVIGLGVMGSFLGIFGSACADAIKQDEGPKTAG
jgi:voltage-gated potassium channel